VSTAQSFCRHYGGCNGCSFLLIIIELKTLFGDDTLLILYLATRWLLMLHQTACKCCPLKSCSQLTSKLYHTKNLNFISIFEAKRGDMVSLHLTYICCFIEWKGSANQKFYLCLHLSEIRQEHRTLFLPLNQLSPLLSRVVNRQMNLHLRRV